MRCQTRSIHKQIPIAMVVPRDMCFLQTTKLQYCTFILTQCLSRIYRAYMIAGRHKLLRVYARPMWAVPAHKTRLRTNDTGNTREILNARAWQQPPIGCRKPPWHTILLSLPLAIAPAHQSCAQHSLHMFGFNNAHGNGSPLTDACVGASAQPSIYPAIVFAMYQASNAHEWATTWR